MPETITYADINSLVIQLQNKLQDGENIENTYAYYQVLQPIYGALESGGNLLDKIEHDHWDTDRDSTKLGEYFWKRVDGLIDRYDPDIGSFAAYAKTTLYKNIDYIQPKQKVNKEIPTTTKLEYDDNQYYTSGYATEIDAEEINARINKCLDIVKNRDYDRALYFWTYIIDWVNQEIVLEADDGFYSVLINDQIAYVTENEDDAHKELYRLLRVHQKLQQRRIARQMEEAGLGSFEGARTFIKKYMLRCQHIFGDIKPNTTYNKNRRKRLGQRAPLKQNKGEKDQAERYHSSFAKVTTFTKDRNDERNKKYDEFTKNLPIVTYHISEIE